MVAHEGGTMVELSEEVRERLEGPNFWHLATLNPDGSPHVTPMWVGIEGDRVVFNTAVGRAKVRNLRRDPRVSLSNADPENPYDRIEIRGRVVEFIEGDEAERNMDGFAKKYVGEDVYPWRLPGERRMKLLVEPTRVRHYVGIEPMPARAL
jgi:PPOX class probable F420-dependent enzyme